MQQAQRQFNLLMPYDLYRKLQSVARERETSIGGLLREGANLLINRLKGKALDGQTKNIE